MDDALTERVEALERAVTDGEHDLSALTTEADALERLDRLEDRYDGLDERTAELEAATQALRGYVGNLRAVNEEVQNRADVALAKATALEREDPQGEPEIESSSPSGSRRRSTSEDALTREPEPRGNERRQEEVPGPESTESHTAVDRRDSNRTAHAYESQRRPECPEGSQSNERLVDSERARTGSATTPREEQRAHCEACGQTRPDADDSVPDMGTHQSTPEVSDGGLYERDDDGLDTLGEEDPLVSEEGSRSALSRFRELL